MKIVLETKNKEFISDMLQIAKNRVDVKKKTDEEIIKLWVSSLIKNGVNAFRKSEAKNIFKNVDKEKL